MLKQLMYVILGLIFHFILSGQQITDVCISPNGERLAFGIKYEKGQHLYISDQEGSNKQIIVAKSGYNLDPAWSPDGTHIVYTNCKSRESIIGNVYMQSLVNKNEFLILENIRIDDNSLQIQWLSASQEILIFATKDDNSQILIRMEMNSGKQELIIPEEPNSKYTGPLDSEQICERIRVLASDEFQGRKPGTVGAEKTEQYIKDQFVTLGLVPGNGSSYFQKVPLANFSIIAPSRIKIETQQGQSFEILNKQDFLFSSTYAREEISVTAADWIYAGFGICAPELGWDDYKDSDVKGKVVVVLSGTPDEYTQDSTLWKGDLAANLYAQTFYKQEEAIKRGAKALFVIYKQPAHSFWNWESLANSFGQNKTEIKLSTEEKQLQFFGLLLPNTASILFESSGFIKYDFRREALNQKFTPIRIGRQQAFKFSNAWEELPANNVVGMIPGTDKAEEVIVYTAHWDHVGMGNSDGNTDVIFNGAVDNASGVAGIIEIARAYQKLAFKTKRTILFIAMAAEEMGMLGSRYYVDNPVFPLSKTLASFNMDAHFPYGKTTHITGVVYGRSELDEYLELAAARQGRILVPNTEQNITQNIFFRSDHYPFAVKGVPSEFAVGAGNAMAHDSIVWTGRMSSYMSKYHQVTDEYEEYFDCGGIAQDAELVFMAGVYLDQANRFPAWVRSKTFQRIRQELIKDE